MKYINTNKVLSVLLLIITFAFSSTTTFAQEKRFTINGVVIDKETNDPMPGASVVEKGTVNGAITDIDGKFSIKVKKGSVLKVDFIGYKTRGITVHNKKDLVIGLNSDAEILDDVVIIAYGEVKSKDVTGSVKSAKIKNIDHTAATSVDQMLQGRMAGVNIKSAEGTPGQVMDIQIRGANTITGQSTPLYIVDGFPIDDPEYTASIDPNDIERIDVLKDASSTAIYGSRGANGVVIITTKQGKKGKVSVNFNSKFGVAEIPDRVRLPVLSTYEYVRLQNEQGHQDQWGDEKYYKDVPSKNWQDEIFQPGIFQNYNVSVSGGTDQTKIYMSVGYVEQEGTMIETGFSRFNSRFKIEQKLKEKIKVGSNISYSHNEYVGLKVSSSSVSTIRSAIMYRPLKPIKGIGEDTPVDEEEAVDAGFFNPVSTLENTDRIEPSDVIQINTYIEYKPIKFLKFRSTFSYGLNKKNVKTFYKDGTNQARNSQGISGFINTFDIKSWLNENTVSYSWKRDDHKVNAIGGLTFQKSSIYQTYLGNTNFAFDDWGWNNMGLGVQPVLPKSSLQERSLMSSFARLSYSYKDKYLVDASVRSDGTSLFPSSGRWGVFPSVAFAWRAIEEDFVKEWDIFSNLKFKGGIGSTGNNRIGTWDSFVTYSIGEGGYFDRNFYQGVNQQSLSNTDLTWETTNQANIGTEFGFFRNRLSFEIEAYYKSTDNLLLDALVPHSAGHRTVKQNSGSITNRGLEFNVNSVNIETNDFSWATNFNISFNKNRVESLTEGELIRTYNPGVNDDLKQEKTYALIVGESVGLMYGYTYVGNYQVDDFNVDPSTGELVAKSGVPVVETSVSVKAAPGMPRYKDLNNDGIINELDRKIIGSAQPISYGGMTNTFKYKNFDLNILLTFSYGNDIYNGNKATFGKPIGQANRNYLADVANRWTEENPVEYGMWKAPNYPENHNYITTYKGKLMNSYWIEDGSYLRISNIALGYSLPRKLIRKAGLHKLKFTVIVDNLYVFTNYSGYDPEVSVKREAMNGGVDYSAYPRPRTFTFAMSLGF